MITNYLPELIHCLRPDTDEQEFDAFKYNDSNEPDEFSPESIFGFDDESQHNFYKLRIDD